MRAHLYIEGGESKQDQILCRKGFRKLLEKAGFSGRMPRLSACGGRNSAFDDFKTAHSSCKSDIFVAMLIDSEDPMENIEKTWAHLHKRDRWEKPANAQDNQVFMMTTCMETWITADRTALQRFYGQKLKEKSLPKRVNLEQRNRYDVQKRLIEATRDCSNSYAKGKRSFAVLATLNPSELEKFLPSFVRGIKILDEKLT